MLEGGCAPQFLINTKQGKWELTMKRLILLHDRESTALKTYFLHVSIRYQIKLKICMVPVQVPILELVYLQGKIIIGLDAFENYSFF